MRTLIFPALLAILCLTDLVKAEDLVVNGKKFTVPDGCTIEVVGKSPLIDRPINCDFDEQGRLYVTESSGTNENVQEQLKKKPHRIVRLEDSDDDGVFDKRTVFADQMMFPEGAMWLDGSLYVCAPPQIWKLTDTNDDGVADQREVWFDGKTLTGCANDLHGPYLGPDGWIYWCKGAFAEQTYEVQGRPAFVTRASHIFRRRPEGGPVEHVMTGGMDNPVELVFTPDGERVFNATFLHHPHDGKRDGLVHAIYGGVYGKDHGVLEGHSRTGDLMPVMADHDASAPSGLVRLRSNHFGEPYQNNILCSSFNMHKIFRHRVSYQGSLLHTQNEDFVVCHDLDFHPTDIIEDADGSILIVDTGGWYKLCCPTSQLHKPDVLGAIYRVRRKDAKPLHDARGLTLNWANIDATKLIGDSRFAVRERAQQLAANRKQIDALAAILHDQSSTEFKRLQAVWTLAKCSQPAARAANRVALVDSSPTVNRAAAHAASVWKDQDALADLLKLLKSKSPANRRVAAEALGRIGNSTAVEALLTAAQYLVLRNGRADVVQDRGLEHSIVYALIQIGDREAIAKGLKSSNMMTRHVALLALHDLEDRSLTKQYVLGVLRSSNPLLKKTAWRVVRSHPEWADGLTGYFRDKLLSTMSFDESELRQFIKNPKILATVLEVIQMEEPQMASLRARLLKVVMEAKLKELPESWNGLPNKLLASNHQPLVMICIQWIKQANPFPNADFQKQLLRIARNRSFYDELRLLAYSACRSSPKSDEEVDFIAGFLSTDFSVTVRSLAVDSLQRSQLDETQLSGVASGLDLVGPGEIERLIKILLQAKSNQVNRKLLDTLGKSKAVLAIDPAKLTKMLGDLAGHPNSVSLLAKIEKQKKQETQRMNQILSLVESADIRKGQLVFHSNKASCIACHQMGYLGGRIGPSLSRIGRIRSERDLLESLMFPSISFVRSYEPVVVETTQGLQFSGVVKNENSTYLELTLDAQKSVRINKADIEQRKTGTRSIMPSGLDKQFTDQELAHLIKFLKASN